MTRRSSRLEWLPPLLVGASAAVAAEVAVSMLLYGGAGFVRSLTTLLAVEGLALAAGLGTAPEDGPGLVDRVRRRWLLCLSLFVAAALFGMAWSIFPEVSAGRPGQGAGLAILGAAPLYSAGVVLGGMGVLARSDPGRRLRMPGAYAAAGAALGFVLTGVLLPRVPLPSTLLLGCLVMLSLAGMLYGGVLGARTEVRVLARRRGRGPDVRVEERRTPIDDVAVLELLEGPFVRRRVPLDVDAAEPWDICLVRSLLPDDPEAYREMRVLSVGGGASGLTRALLRGHPTARIDVLERTAAVVELGREHFDTELRAGRHERVSVSVGNLDDGVLACDGGYDLVIVDTVALAPVGGLGALSRMARRRLPDLLRPDGILACGPGDSLLDAQIESGWRAKRYHRRARHGAEGELELLVILERDDGEPWYPAIGGFEEVSGP